MVLSSILTTHSLVRIRSKNEGQLPLQHKKNKVLVAEDGIEPFLIAENKQLIEKYRTQKTHQTPETRG